MPTPVGTFSKPNLPMPLSLDMSQYPTLSGIQQYGAYGNPGSPLSTVQNYSPVAPNQQNPMPYKIAAAAQGGLGAGSQVRPTVDSGDAVLQTLSAGGEGAATGAAVGGPWGAVVGGVVGTAVGGAQAFMGLKSARASRRKQEQIQAAIVAKEQERYDQARADTQDQIAYNRKQNVYQSQWNAYLLAGQKFNDLLSQDDSLRQTFIAEGR